MDTKVYRNILQKLKGTKGCFFSDLVEFLPNEFTRSEMPPQYELIPFVDKLMNLGLVEAWRERDGTIIARIDKIDHRLLPETKVFLSKQAIEIERQLEVNLAGHLSPIWGAPASATDWPDLFVLMPFEPDLRPVYDDHIKKVAEDMQLSCARGDDFLSTGDIIREIWSAINGAKIVIADCTHRNPNVFYEIGVAHTVGKETILISQSIDDVPFDLRHLRIIIYSYTPRGVKDFERLLESTIQRVLGRLR